jgi:hypothetical protein
MKKCLFCSNAADSLEHIIPQWLLYRIAPNKEGRFPMQVGRYIDGQGYLDTRNFISITFMARIVCEQCNNGWMSQLESEVGRILHPLIAEDFPILYRENLTQIHSQSHLLALWLAKTALTTSLALPGKLRLPETFASQVSLRNAPVGSWVDLAKAQTTGIGIAFSKAIPTFNGRVFVGNQIHKSGASFQFCLQVNHLLLRIGMCQGAQVGYALQKGQAPYRLFPKPSPQLPEHFEFTDVNQFFHSIALFTWAGCEGEVPLAPGI